MTIDLVAAAMRERFTNSGGKPVMITAEEWDVLSASIYLRDALEEIESEHAEVVSTKIQELLTQIGRRG